MAEELGETAKSAGLALLGQRPPVGRYLGETFRRLPFASTLAAYRLQADFQQHRLGILWVLLSPTLTALVYGVIFFFILSSAAKPDDFIPFLLIGVFIFGFFSQSLAEGARSIVGNGKLVQSLSFPRALLPISATLEQALRMGPVTLLLVVLLLLFRVPPSWGWLLIVPVIALMGLFNLGVALFAARLSVHFRDLQQVIPFVTRVLFYTSGVFFSPDLLLAGQPVLLGIVHWLPTYDYIAIARAVLMPDHPADPIVWLAAVVWAVVALVVGFLFFWRAEIRYGIDD
jgi:teichoic acid transport system permease protein